MSSEIRVIGFQGQVFETGRFGADEPRMATSIHDAMYFEITMGQRLIIRGESKELCLQYFISKEVKDGLIVFLRYISDEYEVIIRADGFGEGKFPATVYPIPHVANLNIPKLYYDGPFVCDD